MPTIDRQFDPRYLFDTPVEHVERMQEHLNAFAAECGFKARVDRLSDRVPHVERARLAVEIGVATFNLLWAVAWGLPGCLPGLGSRSVRRP